MDWVYWIRGPRLGLQKNEFSRPYLGIKTGDNVSDDRFGHEWEAGNQAIAYNPWLIGLAECIYIDLIHDQFLSDDLLSILS